MVFGLFPTTIGGYFSLMGFIFTNVILFFIVKEILKLLHRVNLVESEVKTQSKRFDNRRNFYNSENNPILRR